MVCFCDMFLVNNVSLLMLQHAHALELLSAHLYEGASALDVGSGSGYLTVCMALLVGLQLLSI
jgi:protein-L-isoaspartate O-methyltransferase